MASKLLTPNLTSGTNVTIPGNIEPSCNSFGHISFPKKSGQFSSYTHSCDISSYQHAVTTSVNSVVRSNCVNLANFWREIQGSKNWENLVEPLHPLLRQEIIRYGEFVNACYKAFELDPNSRRFLNCKYGKKSMLKNVGLENSGYRITKYIYATPDVNLPPIHNAASCGRWVGYVAVSTDEEVERLGRRDVLVAFRGTATNPEWFANFMSSLTPARLDPHDPRPDVKVESGFLGLYTSDESHSKFGLESCREQLLSEISRLLNEYRGEELSVTLSGHSMGSSLAVLLGYDIAELGLNRMPGGSDREIPVTVFSFGGPRVGNSGFKRRCEELGVRVLRIVNVNDPITNLPGVFFNEKFGILGEMPWMSYSCYTHVGVELELDFFDMQNPSCVHDLEMYIGLLKRPKRSMAGRGTGLDFFMGRARDLISSAQKFGKILPWKDYATAINMGNSVQSHQRS